MTTETPLPIKYILCFDTNKYAGNFERDLTAYATGQIGECEVGDDQAELFYATVPQEDIDEIKDKILQESDENGCYRPCEIQLTQGWVNDGMGNQYKQSKDVEPTAEQVDTWRKLRRAYAQRMLDQATRNKWTGIAAYQKALANVDTAEFRWYPVVYNSVGIFFSKPLSDAALKVIIARAKEYCTREDITLEGVRLITEFSYTKSEDLDWR